MMNTVVFTGTGKYGCTRLLQRWTRAAKGGGGLSLRYSVDAQFHFMLIMHLLFYIFYMCHAYVL